MTASVFQVWKIPYFLMPFLPFSSSPPLIISALGSSPDQINCRLGLTIFLNESLLAAAPVWSSYTIAPPPFLAGSVECVWPDVKKLVVLRPGGTADTQHLQTNTGRIVVEARMAKIFRSWFFLTENILLEDFYLQIIFKNAKKTASNISINQIKIFSPDLW